MGDALSDVKLGIGVSYVMTNNDSPYPTGTDAGTETVAGMRLRLKLGLGLKLKLGLGQKLGETLSGSRAKTVE